MRGVSLRRERNVVFIDHVNKQNTNSTGNTRDIVI